MIRHVQRLVEKIYGAFLVFRDNVSAKQCEASVGDIILKRAELEHCQFLLTARKMDIEAYCSGDDLSFPFQNTISRALYGKEHEEELGNRQFAELIKSYKDNGYDSSSYLIVDNDCRLLDGNHRMGMNLYMGIERVNVRVIRRESHNRVNLDRYIELGMTSSFMNRVINEFNAIQEWLVMTGNTFCCLLYGEYEKEDISLINDLKLMTKVLRTTYLNETGNSKVGALVQFSLNTPCYKVNNGVLLSKRALEIQNLLEIRKFQFGLNVEIKVAKSCLEGKELWDSIRGRII